ncbi:hypothetical protein NEOKW01_1879 [Nematocida sp. AWRm80]|nr:hypothetical protein NEOKW01_1879 [Nematocida sp. AWRm80]
MHLGIPLETIVSLREVLEEKDCLPEDCSIFVSPINGSPRKVPIKTTKQTDQILYACNEIEANHTKALESMGIYHTNYCERDILRKRMLTTTWKHIYSVIGTNIIRLFQEYHVLERHPSIPSSFYLYLTRPPAPKRPTRPVPAEDTITIRTHKRLRDDQKYIFGDHLEILPEKQTKVLDKIHSTSLTSLFLRYNRRLKRNRSVNITSEEVSNALNSCMISDIELIKILRRMIRYTFKDILDTRALQDTLTKVIALFSIGIYTQIPTRSTNTLSSEYQTEIELSYITKGIRTRSRILTDKSLSPQYTSLVHTVVQYILTEYVPSVIHKNTVYINNRLYYKSKYIWLAGKTKYDYIRNNYTKVDNTRENRDRILKECYSVRMVPGKTKFRAITKLIEPEDNRYTAKNKQTTSKIKSYKRNVCSVLTKEINEKIKWEETRLKRALNTTKTKRTEEQERPERQEIPPRKRTYNSVISIDQIISRLSIFQEKYKDRLYRRNPLESLETPRHSSEEEKKDSLFLLVIDLSDCFDKIRHDVIHNSNIISKIHSKEEYIGYLLTETKDKNTKQTRIVLDPEEHSQNNPVFKDQPAKTIRRIYNTYTITKKDITNELNSMVDHHYIRYKEEYYKRIKGIPQGGHYSTHLCSYYLAEQDTLLYADLENTYVTRYIDDILVLSWSIIEIKSILRRIEREKESKGMYLNLKKSKLYSNRPVTEHILSEEYPIPLEYSERINWCGLIIYTDTLNTYRKSIRTIFKQKSILRRLARRIKEYHQKIKEDREDKRR